MSYEINFILNMNDNIFNKVKLNISEFFVRVEIQLFLLSNYRQHLKDSVGKLELNNPNVYKPKKFIQIFLIFLPFYILHSNIFILFIFRNNFSFNKYFGTLLFNILSINYICLILEKKLFIEYIKHPNHCSKYMREEYILIICRFLRRKDEVTPESYEKVLNINNEIIKKYKF